jgi:hypothetical protein
MTQEKIGDIARRVYRYEGSADYRSAQTKAHLYKFCRVPKFDYEDGNA